MNGDSTVSVRHDGMTREFIYAPTRADEGWPGIVHGGILFKVFDDAVSAAARQVGWRCVTARAAIRFHVPVCIGEPLLIRASVRGRPRLVLGTGQAVFKSDGRLAASFEATLMPYST